MALTPYSSALDELESLGGSDGYVCEVIGGCLLALGRADEAQPHFARRTRFSPAIPPPRTIARLGRLRSLAGATQIDP